RIEARLGQHEEFATKAFVKFTPWSTRSDCTVGIAQSESHRWSSVRIRTMFGGVAARASRCAQVPERATTDSRHRAVRAQRFVRVLTLLRFPPSDTSATFWPMLSSPAQHDVLPLQVHRIETISSSGDVFGRLPRKGLDASGTPCYDARCF